MRAVHEGSDDRQAAGEIDRVMKSGVKVSSILTRTSRIKPLNREGAKVARKTRITNFLVLKSFASFASSR